MDSGDSAAPTKSSQQQYTSESFCGVIAPGGTEKRKKELTALLCEGSALQQVVRGSILRVCAAHGAFVARCGRDQPHRRESVRADESVYHAAVRLPEADGELRQLPTCARERLELQLAEVERAQEVERLGGRVRHFSSRQELVAQLAQPQRGIRVQ